MPKRQYQDVRQASDSPLVAGEKLNPAHKIGAPYEKGYELASNREMGDRAQRRATVHALEPGITGAGIGRKGRKGRKR